MPHLIQTILGKQSTLDVTHQTIAIISLHWYESARRIMRKTSAAGVAVAFKLFKKGSRWRMTMCFFVTLPG
jgi:urease accessory protein UreE